MMIKVAVYGTLKQGHGNHVLLKEATFLSQEQSKPEFTMYDTGGFPAVVHKGDTSLVCEVYEVTEEQFRRLDGLEGYPSMYNREVFTFGDHEAWIYLWQWETDMPVVESGEW